jgi:hypothetical protein
MDDPVLAGFFEANPAGKMGGSAGLGNPGRESPP